MKLETIITFCFLSFDTLFSHTDHTDLIISDFCHLIDFLNVSFGILCSINILDSIVADFNKRYDPHPPADVKPWQNVAIASATENGLLTEDNIGWDHAGLRLQCHVRYAKTSRFVGTDGRGLKTLNSLQFRQQLRLHARVVKPHEERQNERGLEHIDISNDAKSEEGNAPFIVIHTVSSKCGTYKLHFTLTTGLKKKRKQNIFLTKKSASRPAKGKSRNEVTSLQPNPPPEILNGATVLLVTANVYCCKSHSFSKHKNGYDDDDNNQRFTAQGYCEPNLNYARNTAKADDIWWNDNLRDRSCNSNVDNELVYIENAVASKRLVNNFRFFDLILISFFQ